MNNPQKPIRLMIMKINLSSPQHASVVAPFHFSFHRYDDVASCLFFRFPPSLLLMRVESSVFLTHVQYTLVCTRTCYSADCTPPLHLLPRPVFFHLRFSSFPSSSSSFLSSCQFFFIFASPRPFGSCSLHRRRSSTLALPRSSNLPIVRFRRIRPEVMDYRSAHTRSVIFLLLSGIVIATENFLPDYAASTIREE